MNKRLTRLFEFVLIALFLASCSSSKPSEGLGVYPKAVGAADEASAIQALRTIATAEAQLKATSGVYGDFDALTKAGVLDQRFVGTTPIVRGYRFTISVADSDFSVSADPQTSEAQPTTGTRHFFLDSSDNAIHANTAQPASMSDPLV